MYSGHFAVALAIKAAEPRAPLASVLAAVFLPDLLWLGCCAAALETVEPGIWFDGWSHSIASMIVQAAIVAVLGWWRWGRPVSAALAGAVLSHLVLDLPMHPAPLPWHPYANVGVGDFLHGWAPKVWLLGKSNGWWIETTIVSLGLAFYLVRSDRAGITKEIAIAGSILVASLQVAFG